MKIRNYEWVCLKNQTLNSSYMRGRLTDNLLFLSIVKLSYHKPNILNYNKTDTRTNEQKGQYGEDPQDRKNWINKLTRGFNIKNLTSRGLNTY